MLLEEKGPPWGPQSDNVADPRGIHPDLIHAMEADFTAWQVRTVSFGVRAPGQGPSSQGGQLCESHDDSEGHTNAGRYITEQRASACTFASAKPDSAVSIP